MVSLIRVNEPMRVKILEKFNSPDGWDCSQIQMSQTPQGQQLSHAKEDGRELSRHSTILHHLVPEEKASHEWVQASDNLFTKKTGQTTLLSYKDRSVDPTTHCSLDKFSFLSFKSSLFLGWSIRMGCEYSKIERNIYFGIFVFNIEMINVSSVFFGFLGARTVFVTFSFLWVVTRHVEGLCQKLLL